MFESEPDVPSALLALDNVVLTPHIGSATWQTRQAMADLAFGNLQAHFAGRPLLSPVPEMHVTATAPFDLSGRRALVTGGGSGPRLGDRARPGAAGATRRPQRPQRGHARRGGRRAARRGPGAWRPPPSTSPMPMRSAPASQTSQARLGAIDILVNNAGIQHRAPIAEFSDADWRRLMATNLDAPFYMARAVIPAMQARRSGKIINIASLMSSLARPTTVPYQVSKGGIAMLTRGLAVELRRTASRSTRSRPASSARR